jgi:homoserine dehydrogenase
MQAHIRKVCIRQGDKPRNAPAALFTTDADVLLDDPEINVVVELIDDADAAYHIVRKALSSGKAVVSANKRMIAGHLEELLGLQQKFKVPFLYEAACCASIPVIRNLEEYYDNDLLRGVSGIVNGSTNYILTKIAEEGLAFPEALALAQKAGFAESDPALDIEGTDAANKLSILLLHAFGILTSPSGLLCFGIDKLGAQDSTFAAENGYVIKLIARAQKLSDGSIAAFVAPQFVEPEDKLCHVDNEYNGVVIESSFADKQFFYGKGAGGLATASAVLSDLSALRYQYSYEYRKLARGTTHELTNDIYLKVYAGFEDAKNATDLNFHEEWTRQKTESGISVTGLVHISQLLEDDRWRRPGVSVVLLPDCIVEPQLVVAQEFTVAGCELGEL